jgi:hypothetical protein
MPYGFYILVRFVALVGFSALAYCAHEQKKEVEMIICILLALLFQPFFKLALGRELWNVVDIIVAILLIVSLFVKIKNSDK